VRVIPSLIIPNNRKAIRRVVHRWRPVYVIKRRHSRREEYYKATLYGYKWVSDRKKATVFRGMEQVYNELSATWVQYESDYEIIKV
jgi:hypothetical protein